MTNTNKLKGRMVEMGYTLTSLAEALGISRPAFRRKVNGMSDFKVSEIEKICKLLHISKIEMPDYFFTFEVPEMETITA